MSRNRFHDSHNSGEAHDEAAPFGWADPRTFFLAPECWQPPYVLGNEDAQHVRKVLRLSEGDEIRVLDGAGREGAFRIAALGKREVELELLQSWTHPRPNSGVILAAGWTKSARRSWIMEKAVEFGAAGVWFWQAERSQFPVPEEARENWHGQLVAGAKQCRNPWLPEVRTLPQGVAQLVSEVDTLVAPVARHVLLEDSLVDESHPARPLLPKDLGVPGLTVCVIGPEGGFTSAEAEHLKSHSFTPFSLGKRVLRWETAALLCLGLHWWNGEQHEDSGSL